MADIWHIIGALGAELHRDRIEAIAKAISDTASVHDIARTQRAFGPNLDERQFTALRSAWLACPELSPREVAAALRSASRTAEMIVSAGAAEVVWTGPKTGFIPTRSTEQVFLEVIDSAKSELFVVSYVFYNATVITDALLRAIGRGVTVRVLLELSTDDGGAVYGDSMKKITDAVVGLEMYVWDHATRSSQKTGLSAVVHAKCVVADGELAFITSANLTSAALERNMELGVLLRGGSAPKSLNCHLRALITTKEISRWVS